MIAPPEAPRSIKAGKLSGEHAPIQDVGMGGLVVEFGRTQLESVRKSAGGAITAKTDASARWLCYTVETGRRIWLTSEAAAKGAVSAVTIVAQPGVSGETACPDLSPRLQPSDDIAGISLGQRRADVEAQLGRAGGGDWARYEGCSAFGATTKICNAITLRYVNNRVMQITASRTSG